MIRKKFPILSWVKYYYASTVLFILVDLFCGVNVRAAGFAVYPMLRGLYYAGCLGCFFVIYRKPHWSVPVVLIESVINLFVLILGVLAPYYDFVLSGDIEKAISIFSFRFVANFAIAASVGLIAYYQAQSALESE